MGTRRQNEVKFGSWRSLQHGGREYWLDVPGRHGWTARYIKEVDSDEVTLRFLQEIRNDKREVVEVHVKYPEDKGHIRTRSRR
jgi:hypothetical protein